MKLSVEEYREGIRELRELLKRYESYIIRVKFKMIKLQYGITKI